MSTKTGGTMASAVDELKTTLANLNRESTDNLNDLLRKAETLTDKARRLAGAAEPTQKLVVLPGGAAVRRR